MKTILEIQKLDRQIKQLQRAVETCPAGVEYKKYKESLQEGKARFAQLESQANEIIKNYNIAETKFSKLQGNSEIVRKRNQDNMTLDAISSLIGDANGLVGDLSEENRSVEDLVRKAEEVVRKSAELSQKLTEAKIRAGKIKEAIEAKRQEVAPQIAEIEKQIKALEPQVADKELYEKYKELKGNGIFPVYVNIEDNFCGYCKVELPISFVDKLKIKKMLPCEHCGRIIMFK